MSYHPLDNSRDLAERDERDDSLDLHGFPVGDPGEMSQYGYGGQQNPYAQGGGGLPSGPRAGGGGLPSGPRGGRGAAPAPGPPGGGFRQEYNDQTSPAYGGGNYGGSSPSMGRDDYGGQNVEMAPLAQNGQRFAGGGAGGDPNAILNECREIDKGIDNIEQNLQRLQMLQQQSLNDPDASLNSQTNRQLDQMSSETMTLYRNFAGRIKAIKQQPESGAPKNAPQVGKVDRKLKAAINKYQNVESDFRRKMQDQMARQYRIVRPDASEAEVREAVEDTSNQQVFSQALMQSDRQGQSRAALSAVEDRHKAIQKIEQQMIELAELFQDMEALVVQQEAAVENIEMKGEEVVENMDKGTQEIGTAIVSARARNRKKWWCLGICVAIVIVIVIIVLIYKFVIQGTSSTKSAARRSLGAQFHESHRVVSDHIPGGSISSRRVVPAKDLGKRQPIQVPGLEWKGEKLVVPGAEYAGSGKAVIPGAGFKDGAVVPGASFGGGKAVVPGVDFKSSKAVVPGAGFKDGAVVPGASFGGGKAVIPGVDFKSSKAVVPGADFKDGAVQPGVDFKGSKAVAPGVAWRGGAVVPGADYKEGN